MMEKTMMTWIFVVGLVFLPVFTTAITTSYIGQPTNTIYAAPSGQLSSATSTGAFSTPLAAPPAVSSGTFTSIPASFQAHYQSAAVNAPPISGITSTGFTGTPLGQQTAFMNPGSTTGLLTVRPTTTLFGRTPVSSAGSSFSSPTMFTNRISTTGTGFSSPTIGSGLTFPTVRTGLTSSTAGTGFTFPTVRTGLSSPTLGTGRITPIVQPRTITPIVGQRTITPLASPTLTSFVGQRTVTPLASPGTLTPLASPGNIYTSVGSSYLPQTSGPYLNYNAAPSFIIPAGSSLSGHNLGGHSLGGHSLFGSSHGYGGGSGFGSGVFPGSGIGRLLPLLLVILVAISLINKK